MTLPVGTLACRLVVNSLRGELRRFSLDQNVIRIGRAIDCEVQLPYEFLSPEHCRLVQYGGGFRVEDAGAEQARLDLQRRREELIAELLGQGRSVRDSLAILRRLDPGGAPGGIFLNNKEVRRAALHVGDKLYFGGNLLFHFEHQGSPAIDTKRHPLMDAICADPHDDGPRLVYADWLCERGDPRGEFIHYQIQADRLPAGDPQRTAMEAKAEVLQAQHEHTWVQPLPLFVESWQFRHGFLSEVRIDARAALHRDDFAALRRAHPIRTVDFITGTLTPALREQLTASSRLDGVEWWAP